MSKWAIRPSSLPRLVACSGSHRVCRDAPAWLDDYGDNTAREEGTAAHWLANENACGRYPKLGTVAPNGVATTEEMQLGVDLYLAQLDVENGHFEEPMAIPLLGPDCGGTPDYWYYEYTTNTLYVWDFKFGRRLVQAWVNYQLIAYALGVCTLLDLDPRNVNFVFGIVQPRAAHRDGPVRSKMVSGIELMAPTGVILAAINEAKSEISPCVPNDHCKDCAGRARCPVTQDIANSFSFDFANDLTLPQAEDELRYLLQIEKLLEGRISGLTAQVQHAAIGGARLSRFELARSKPHLQWKPEHIETVKSLAKLMKLEVETEPKLITPTQLAKKSPELAALYSHRPQGSVKLEPQDPAQWVEIFSRK